MITISHFRFVENIALDSNQFSVIYIGQQLGPNGQRAACFVSHSTPHPGGFPESSIMGTQGQAVRRIPLPLELHYPSSPYSLLLEITLTFI
jgi:hypothetical protein